MTQEKTISKVGVLGSGSWGTALAHHLRRAGLEVELWGRDAKVLESIAADQLNPKYVVGLKLATGIKPQADILKVIAGKDLLVVALPSKALRGVVSSIKQELLEAGPAILSGIKGLDSDSLMTATQVLADELGSRDLLAALGGPSFAAELIQGYPTAITVAAYDPDLATRIRNSLHFGNVRAYSSSDVVGVEFGGAIKNVMAVATGLVDGIGMGHNARAALITRGLAETQQLVAALGGDIRTVVGLAGLGDLLLTAVGDLSRNRQVGLRLGKGESLDQIQKDLGQVAEGVRSSALVLELAKKNNIDMPIVEQTNAVISGQRSVSEAVAELLAREPKHEI